MKVFKSFNSNTICPICKTNEDKETVLVPIDGTEKGRIAEAVQIHLECINIRISNEQINGNKLIYQLL